MESNDTQIPSNEDEESEDFDIDDSDQPTTKKLGIARAANRMKRKRNHHKIQSTFSPTPSVSDDDRSKTSQESLMSIPSSPTKKKCSL